jgi:hypothetical protein
MPRHGFDDIGSSSLPEQEVADMQYMLIETFWPAARDKITERFDAKGRMLPRGLRHIRSWSEINGNRYFHLMETSDKKLIEKWMTSWRDLIEFKVVPVEELNLEEKEKAEPAVAKQKAPRK